MILEWLRSLARGSPDEYRIIRSGPNEERAVIEKGLQEVPDPDMFELERDLEPGTYRCQAIRNGKFGEMKWVRVVGDPQEAREIDELRRELREIKSAVASDSRGRPDVEEMVEHERAKLALAALNSEEFVSRYGDKIALGMFDGDEGSVDFDSAMEHPVGAALWELKEDPQKLSDLVGSLLSAGGAPSDWPPEEDGPADTGEDEGSLDLSGVDSGPTTLADLEAAGEEVASAGELADELEDDQATLDEADQGSEPDEPDETDAEAVAAEMTAEREAAADGGQPPDPAEVADEL